MHERYPTPSEMLANTRPSVNVWDDWSVAKPRGECQPFTFTFAAPHDERDVKAQEKFTKALGTLERKIAREQKTRAKKLKVAA